MHETESFPYFIWEQHVGSKIVPDKFKTYTAGHKGEYRTEFGLGSDISVTVASQGSGKVLVDGMTLPSTNYTGKFFAGNDLLLTAVPSAGSTFTGWTDGNADNPRLVSPEDGDKFTAKFQ